jgi:hypothetical protein
VKVPNVKSDDEIVFGAVNVFLMGKRDETEKKEKESICPKQEREILVTLVSKYNQLGRI